ncbi:MAG: tetratricopeptide repeat protein [Mariniblastus sp.]
MAAKKISPEVQAILSASDLGLLATTVKLVEKFLVDNPASQRAWLDLGRALVEMSRYDVAESAFQKAIELADGGPVDVIFGELGNLFRAKGDFDTAIGWYQKQIEADPNDGTGYLFLGNILFRQGNAEASIEACQKAAACEQVCLEEVHFSLGVAYRSLGNYSQAKTEFETALKLEEKFNAAKIALKDVTSALRD